MRSRIHPMGTTAASSRQSAVSCCRPPGQADGLIRLSGRIPAGGDTQSIIMSPGQRPSPADLGKAGCSWPRPRPPPLITPAQKGRPPEPLNRTPHHQGSLPAAAGMIRSRPAASRAPAAPHAGAARPLTRPPARRTWQLSGDREQTQPSPDHGDHDRRYPESNPCGHRQMQVRADILPARKSQAVQSVTCGAASGRCHAPPGRQADSAGRAGRRGTEATMSPRAGSSAR